MPKDQVSRESKVAFNDQSKKQKVGTILKTVGKVIGAPIREPLGLAANAAARSMAFTTVNRTNDVNGTNNPDMARLPGMAPQGFGFDTMTHNGQNLDGYYMPPTAGKPTIVYFGGSDFDRGTPEYRRAISSMAAAAKAQGCGFACYDYPPGSSEQEIADYVQSVQNHLVNNKGVSLDQQAYSGYSMGSFAASHAANLNPDGAGLQIISGFSSSRLAQKEGIKGFPVVGKVLDVLATKRHLSEVMDTAKECRELRGQLDQRAQNGQSVMPISTVHSSTEDFGQVGNRHMDPVINELRGNNRLPHDSVHDGNNVGGQYTNMVRMVGQDITTTNIGGVTSITQPNVEHLDMMESVAQSQSFNDFVTKSVGHYGQQQGLNQGVQQGNNQGQLQNQGQVQGQLGPPPQGGLPPLPNQGQVQVQAPLGPPPQRPHPQTPPGPPPQGGLPPLPNQGNNTNQLPPLHQGQDNSNSSATWTRTWASTGSSTRDLLKSSGTRNRSDSEDQGVDGHDDVRKKAGISKSKDGEGGTSKTITRRQSGPL